SFEAKVVKMGPWLVSVIGIIGGFLLLLMGIYIYRRSVFRESKSSPEEGAFSVSKITDDKAREYYRLEIKIPTIPTRLMDFIPSTRFCLYTIAALLAGAILFSTFFGNISIFGFIIRLRYLLIMYFIFCLAYKIDSRISIGIALFLLACCPILLIRGNDAGANYAAMVAYAFLAMGVFFQLIEYFRERRVSVEEEEFERPVHEPRMAATKSTRKIPYRLSSRAVIARRKARLRALVRLAALLVAMFCLIGGLYAAGHWLFVSRKAQKIVPEATKKAERASQTKVVKAKPEAKPALEIDKSKIKIQVLNGNGVQGEAARIADILRESGFNIQTVGDAGYDAYPNTIIRHKPGQEDVAKLVVKEIASFYPALFYPNLADSDVDIVVILGRDKKGGLVAEPVVDKSRARIDVLNGNGIAGSAKEIADLLKRNGFNIRDVRDADRYDYAQTIICYRTANKDVAQLVADQIKAKYSAILRGDSSIQADIIVILGRR
ncbi:MAG: LytR C-terminal domain-containing protein, partial [Actinomycetota bacterium]